HVLAGEIGHEGVKLVVAKLVEDATDAGIAVEVAPQMVAPAGPALVDEGGIERVGAGIDPLAQMLAVRAREGGFQALAVFERDDAPAHHAEERVDAVEQPVADDGVEALAVIVDHPPEIANVMLPAFEQRLEDIAFVELGIADQGDHAAGRALGGREPLPPPIVLDDPGEERDADAEPP